MKIHLFNRDSLLKFSFLFAVCAFFACTTQQAPLPETPDPESRFQRLYDVKADVGNPPWQLWSDETFDNSHLDLAEEALSFGQLESAIQSYHQAYVSSQHLRVREEALLRKFGTMLKLGRGKKVLEGLSRYVASQNLKIDSVGERFSLLAAFAYLDQFASRRDRGSYTELNQSLAWFEKTIKAGNGGPYTNMARQQVKELLSSLDEAPFRVLSSRWEVNPTFRKAFAIERVGRISKPKAKPSQYATWFRSGTYRTVSKRLRSSDSVVAASGAALGASAVAGASLAASAEEGDPNARQAAEAGERLVAVLLPLSGKYAEHALQVKQGISLAFSEHGGGKVDVRFYDTHADAEKAASQYEQAVGVDSASIVLGPLLAATSERIAAKSAELGVPFISFTKKQGLASSGPTAFRLGATSENQVEELLSFATGELGLRRLAVAYPQTPSGYEFSDIFKAMAELYDAQVVSEASFVSADKESAISAAKHVSRAQPEAVFVPEDLDFSFEVLRALKEGGEESSKLRSVRLLGPAVWNEPVAVRGFGHILDGAIFVTPFNHQSEQPEVTAFLESYRSRYSQAPDLLAAQGYDAARLAIDAFDYRFGDTASFISRLESLPPLRSVTGKLAVRNDGEIHRRMSVMTLADGEVSEIMFAGIHLADSGENASSAATRKVITEVSNTSEPTAKVIRQPLRASGSSRVPVTEFGENKSSVR